MPELFGMPYLLPAIIVVVLLAALVFALAASRRRRTARAPEEMRRVERGTAPYSPLGASEVAQEHAADWSEMSGVDAAPLVAAEGPAETAAGGQSTEVAGGALVSDAPIATPGTAAVDARTAAGWPAEESRPAGTSGGQTIRQWQDVPTPADQPFEADPITPVLIGLLQGWGELSSAETKRLSVFRPEKLQAAVDALELPKELKTDRDAQARLQQLIMYSSQPEEETPGAASQDIADETTTEAGPETAPANGDQDAVGAEMIAGAAVLAAGISATDGGQGTVPMPDSAAQVASVASLVPLPAGESGQRESEPPALLASPETPLPAMPWALESSEWEEAKAPDVEELEPFDKWPLEASTNTVSGRPGSGAWQVQETSGNLEAEALAAFAAGSAGASHHDPLDDTLETTPRQVPLTGGIVKTADELLALPPEERIEMVAFLQPAELGAVLKRTDNSELKRAIVDTLEHVGTPASLDVLRECLEDRDPEIQMYALQAADRILGV